MHPSQYAAHAALEDTHWWFCARRNIIAAALNRCAPDARKHLLEIGCGTGGNLRFFKSRFAQVTGVDAAPEAIRLAQDLNSGEVLCGDFRALLSHSWECYDALLLADVLEHVEDDAGFLREVVGRMAPGTPLVITVPAHPQLFGPHDVAVGHYRRYTPSALRALWSALPARELYFTPFNAWLLPAVVVARLLRSQKINDDGRSDLHEHGALTNALLYRIFNSEVPWVRHARLPWGSSLLAVLRKE